MAFEFPILSWRVLHDYGIRTVIDLRNSEELTPDVFPRPSDLTTLHIPLDWKLFADMRQDFWAGWGPDRELATPLYYRPHLERYADISAQVLVAIARARPGGVLVHCLSGKDRTGLVSMLLLALAGVAADDIAADHALSGENLRPLFVRLGRPYPGPRIAALLAQADTTAAEVIRATLADLDVVGVMRRAGLEDDDLTALRHRLLGSV